MIKLNQVMKFLEKNLFNLICVSRQKAKTLPTIITFSVSILPLSISMQKIKNNNKNLQVLINVYIQRYLSENIDYFLLENDEFNVSNSYVLHKVKLIHCDSYEKIKKTHEKLYRMDVFFLHL